MITTLILGPIAAAFVLFLVPRTAEAAARVFGLAVAIMVFGISICAYRAPDEISPWLSRPFAANFHVGIGGGIAYWLVALLTLSTVSAIAAARVPRLRDFIALLLMLEGSMAGVFLARDLLLFAVFWDLMLLPVFFGLVGWGGSTTAAWRYLLYNVAGGLTLLLATAAFGVAYGTTDVIGRGGVVPLGSIWGAWIFAGFAFAFLVKTPVWPLHTWMPETYAELPSPMAALVSAVQSKAGLYGLIVIGVPLFAEQLHRAQNLMIVLGIAGLLYGAAMSLIQRDVKRIVAYSSLSHLGLIVVAIAIGQPLAIAGAVVYIIAHGLFSVALFLVLGYVEVREDTRSLARLGGLGARNPKLAGALVFAALAALGLPGLGGFAGELLILSGIYQAGYLWVTLISLVPIVIAAAYMLRLFQGVMQGPVMDDLPQRDDLGWLEIAALAPVVCALVLLGVNPAPLLGSPDGAAITQPPAQSLEMSSHPVLAGEVSARRGVSA